MREARLEAGYAAIVLHPGASRPTEIRHPHRNPFLSRDPDTDYLHPVKLSVKSDYAARAVLSLARHYGEEKAMKVEDLAKANGVPANYLVQILIDLKSRNIVKSVRGKEGGYLLARPPADITLGEVLRTVHGPVFDTSALTDAECPSELREAWKKLQDTLDNAADSITFQHLAEQSIAKQRMYYI